ncbi:MAG: ketoacyl-ACP synthase III [Bacteroidales bacterium]|jgi:3-oxoacyl-[acyl-carrier-protein] synthase-3|nr:ketoacyl-ACP synthase III [Bacteroidales bacterium]MDD4214115.1 ketoacyl-ACP synthase III [Bacteroidales bacterium]
MALFSIPRVNISGLNCCVPKNAVSNKDYKWLGDKERELLIKKTGVVEKRQAPHGMATSDLCFVSAEKIIAGLGWDKEEIGLLLFVSQTPDYVLPATSCILQERLGLSKNCLAFDVNLGCSGFVYALSVAGNYVSNCNINKALLLIGDVNPYASYRDKTTYPLFGSAGAAVALEHNADVPLMYFNLQTDGSGHKAIHIPGGGMRHFLTKEMFHYKRYAKGVIRNQIQVSLDGFEVFNFSLREVVPNIRTLLDFSGCGQDDIDYFIFHQANLLINDSIRKKMKLEPEKVPYSLDKFGNTSSASIPLTINTTIQKQFSSEKLTLLFSGFGVGLSWGSVMLQTENVYCPDIIELK